MRIYWWIPLNFSRCYRNRRGGNASYRWGDRRSFIRWKLLSKAMSVQSWTSNADSLFASFTRHSPRWRTTKSDVLPCFRSGRTLEPGASTTIQLYCGYQVIYSTWDVKLNNVAQCKNAGLCRLLTLSNFVPTLHKCYRLDWRHRNSRSFISLRVHRRIFEAFSLASNILDGYSFHCFPTGMSSSITCVWKPISAPNRILSSRSPNS